MKRTGLIVISVVLPLLVVGLALTSGALPNRSVNYQTKVNLRDLTVWHVGQGNDIYNTVLSRIQQFGVREMRTLDIQVLLRNETLEFVESKRPLLIVFDGSWISNRVNDAKIYSFLRDAARRKANLVALGGATSNFFEVMNKAGVNDLPVDETGIARNPAYFNPPLVGFKMTETNTPEGYSHSYPSLLISNTTNIDVLVETLFNWLGG